MRRLANILVDAFFAGLLIAVIAHGPVLVGAAEAPPVLAQPQRFQVAGVISDVNGSPIGFIVGKRLFEDEKACTDWIASDAGKAAVVNLIEQAKANGFDGIKVDLACEPAQDNTDHSG